MLTAYVSRTVPVDTKRDYHVKPNIRYTSVTSRYDRNFPEPSNRQNPETMENAPRLSRTYSKKKTLEYRKRTRQFPEGKLWNTRKNNGQQKGYVTPQDSFQKEFDVEHSRFGKQTMTDRKAPCHVTIVLGV